MTNSTIYAQLLCDPSNDQLDLITSYVYTPIYNLDSNNNINIFNLGDITGLEVSTSGKYKIYYNFLGSSRSGFKIGLYKNLVSNLLTGTNSVISDTQYVYTFIFSQSISNEIILDLQSNDVLYVGFESPDSGNGEFLFGNNGIFSITKLD